MPFVTVTKDTRIFSPWFPGIEFYDSSGKLHRKSGFTAIVSKGGAYNTGQVGIAYPVTEPTFFEVTEWKNPNYVYFDWLNFRGQSAMQAGVPGFLHGYYGGSLNTGPLPVISKWVHNGEYYFKGTRIEMNPASTAGCYTHLSESQYENTVVAGSVPISSRVFKGGLIRQRSITPAIEQNYSFLVGEARFAGLFSIKQYIKGGMAWGERYEVRCPLSFNVSLLETFTVMDWATGDKHGPTTPGTFGPPNSLASCVGSKPISGNQFINRSTGVIGVINTMMVGTDGDTYTLEMTLPGTNVYGVEVLRFRFEIPYGIE